MTRRSCAALAVVLAAAAAGGGQDAPPKRYQIDARIMAGDPLGSRDAGTLKYLAEPRVVTVAGREATFLTGGFLEHGGERVPFGHTLRVTPESTPTGAVRLRFVLESAENTEPLGDDLHLRRGESRYVRTVAPGEAVRVRWGRSGDRPADRQVWADLTVQEVR